MMKHTIKIKNYRCFGQVPQTIELNSGFTAFVGINNSGKSAILRMIYELRPVWSYLSNHGHLVILGKDIKHNVSGILGVSDCDEIFNHFTNSPIELEFFIQGEQNSFGFTLQISKGNASHVSIQVIGECRLDGTVTDFSSNFQSRDGVLFLGYKQNTPDRRIDSTVSVQEIATFFKLLQNSIYISAFRNIVNAGQNTTLYDLLTGTAFVEQWNEWKVGNRKFERQQITRITEDIRNLFGYKSLEINASSNKTTLRLIIDGNPYSLDEVGSGLAQFILTYATVAVRKPSYILIDEPELNLHPALQQKYLSSLGLYATEGVLFSTHSLGLARNSEKIFSVASDGITSKISAFSKSTDYATLLGEMSFSAYSEIGVESILFVEGVTDIKCMQEFLRKYKKDTKVLVMSLGGEEMINGKREHELSEITSRIDVKNVYAWFDSEKSSAEQVLAKNRKEFLQVCEKIGIKAKYTDYRATENYFTQEAIDKAFGQGKFTALEKFGAKGATSSWPKEENWKIAKEMETIDIAGTDLEKFINEIE